MRSETYQDLIGRLFPSYDSKLGALQTKTVTFQVTDACNLACTYCYQINKHHHSMPFEVAKKFIDMMFENETSEYMDFDTAEAVIIEFIGGEPFLEVKLIDQICDYFVTECIRRNHKWATRYRISICSNGVLYFTPEVQAFMKKHMSHLSFSISIDGNKELHDSCRVFPDGSGSYDLAIAGVRHYVDILGGRMGSKMTLAPQNIMHTFSALKSLLEEGYTDINLNCVYEEGWTVEHAKILYEQLKQSAEYLINNRLHDKVRVSMFEEHFFHPKAEDDLDNWCGGDGRMISVDWRGDIYPCIRYMESSLGTDQEPLCIGNVYTGIFTTEKQRHCSDCLKCITRRTQSTDECFYCPIAEGCSWCTAYNYQLNGTPDKRATFICIMHKARALGNCYYWNLAYRAFNIPKRMKLWLPDEQALEIISQDELTLLRRLERAD